MYLTVSADARVLLRVAGGRLVGLADAGTSPAGGRPARRRRTARARSPVPPFWPGNQASSSAGTFVAPRRQHRPAGLEDDDGLRLRGGDGARSARRGRCRPAGAAVEAHARLVVALGHAGRRRRPRRDVGALRDGRRRAPASRAVVVDDLVVAEPRARAPSSGVVVLNALIADEPPPFLITSASGPITATLPVFAASSGSIPPSFSAARCPAASIVAGRRVVASWSICRRVVG